MLVLPTSKNYKVFVLQRINKLLTLMLNEPQAKKVTVGRDRSQGSLFKDFQGLDSFKYNPCTLVYLIKVRSKINVKHIYYIGFFGYYINYTLYLITKIEKKSSKQ